MSPRFAFTRERQKLAEARMREQAYTDGYLGRPARSPALVYQRSWRRGRAAREALRDDLHGGDAA